MLAARSEPMGKGQAERLAPLIQEVLAEAGVAPKARSTSHTFCP